MINLASPPPPDEDEESAGDHPAERGLHSSGTPGSISLEKLSMSGSMWGPEVLYVGLFLGVGSALFGPYHAAERGFHGAIYSCGVLGSKKLCIWGAMAWEGTKSEHVHVFASRADTSTNVIVLGQTTSRDVWGGCTLRCRRGRKMERSALLLSTFDTHWALQALQPVPSIAGGCIVNTFSEIKSPACRATACDT